MIQPSENVLFNEDFLAHDALRVQGITSQTGTSVDITALTRLPAVTLESNR